MLKNTSTVLGSGSV